MSRDEQARVHGLTIARGIVEADLVDAKAHADWDWIGQSQEALDAIDEALRGASGGGVEDSYIAFQQRRGRLPDLIEGAIEIHRNFMLDDDYDTQRCLDRVIEKLKQARDFYDAPTPDHPAENAKSSGDVRAALYEDGYLWKWVERGLFDEHISPRNALEVMAHHPGAPWKEGRWNVDHKPYAKAFYEAFPRAALARSGKGE
ncbi:hypothetical protein [Rhizorhabdus histidinilytica]|uniref:Uncharacterized protein n=1 Tax=Rhizorhabdus histidinilytica TaxID=439228 RepID=A0A1T5A9H8_9SPHN|nr:hypothetical protein [Rhizorhabdus histidinilytica]SKB31387.1 hypothetical protein SAMN06295920_101718 [Rhizorhabdus histidinilytica]